MTKNSMKNAINENNALDILFTKMLVDFKLYNDNPQDIELITKAYTLAKELHKNVRRRSGEAYMFHPLTVAIMAVKYHLDTVTVCTALLHDVLEDTNYSYEQMAQNFGQAIASNVDCVSKMNKEDYNSANIDIHVGTICKLFRHLNFDEIRGTIVKLLDRDHNMQTMDSMPHKKQIIKSKETVEVYAPLAQGIGTNYLKKELHDLALKYLEPQKSMEIEQNLQRLNAQYNLEIRGIIQNIYDNLKEHNIISYDTEVGNTIKLRVKNDYSVYISLAKGRDYDSIHDLYALQITVPDIESCFQVLNIIHQNYPYFDDKFKDYIHNPKTTGYQAVHTTFVSESGRTYQAQIRTKEMGLRNSLGIMYDLANSGYAKLESIKQHYPFFQSLAEISATYPEDDYNFYEKIRYDLLGDKIYVRSATGKTYSLPVGSTILDYAYCFCPQRAAQIEQGKVNGNFVNIATVLKNQDLVDFTSKESVGDLNTHLKLVKTTKAKMLILERMNNNGK